MMTTRRLPWLLALAFLAGCASAPPSSPLRTADHNVSAAPPLPASWSTTFKAYAASMQCDATNSKSVGLFGTDGRTYTSPNASALASATSVHLAISWNGTIPAQTLRYNFRTTDVDGFTGTATASPTKVDAPTSKIKPDASYHFFMCAQAPVVILNDVYTLTLTYS